VDDSVKQALIKWPSVPACYGWLGLDARGNWYLRDHRAQAQGSFSGGAAGSKGSRLQHEGLIQFIRRNYEPDSEGQWFFQNGPQRVYVELEMTPLIFRLDQQLRVQDHLDRSTQVQTCVLDEQGCLYLATEIGFGLIHSMDMGHAAVAVEQGLWQPLEMLRADLPVRFGYVVSPQAQSG
jgi:hypothetical protein